MALMPTQLSEAPESCAAANSSHQDVKENMAMIV
jgi:hypothetical protein